MNSQPIHSRSIFSNFHPASIHGPGYVKDWKIHFLTDVIRFVLAFAKPLCLFFAGELKMLASANDEPATNRIFINRKE